MLIAGSQNLKGHVGAINALNVFPVPDGDTGTNMSLTMTSGVREVQKIELQTIGDLASQFAKGLLMGARGNSGVILSQLFRGFSTILKNERESTDARTLAQAFQAGVDTAYKAVMKPVEGTILTVAREAAIAGVQSAKKTNDCLAVMQTVVTEAKKTLQKTPDMLPLLKEVGVVDSGGQGLVAIYQGFLSVLSGEAPPMIEESEQLDDLVRAEHHKNAHSFMKTEEIVFGFCTEFMVRFSKEGRYLYQESEFRQDLSTYGDSLLVVSDEELLKVHIHAEQPGVLLNVAQKYGELIKIKIENMREQHAEIVQKDSYIGQEPSSSKEKQKYGIVTVVQGQGIAELFRSLGAATVIEGGQSMNPSTEDVVNAVKETDADTVIVLPNNSNIVMAAKLAAEVSDAQVKIVETRTIAQGLSALMAFSPERTPEENVERMSHASNKVKSGQITKAVRDTSVEGLSIRHGDYIGLYDGDIVTTSSNRTDSVKQLIEQMVSDEDEILTLIYGNQSNEAEVASLVEELEAVYPDIEVEVHQGGQELYDYLLALE
ncbi:MAG TPA: DAK2 domain-containing protein [Candidatus Angelobacter sp.]|nr:DAK2 domain-containing protein [Candidatus Angelobacter sp.]